MPPGPKRIYTNEERKERNREAARRYQAQKRQQETPEQAEIRRESQRAYYYRRFGETPERAVLDSQQEREGRNARNRESYRARNPIKTKEQEEAERAASALKRQERNQEYMARLRSSPEYKLRQNEAARARYLREKHAAFAAYGGERCACCGETIFEFLVLDHINGRGNEHRQQFGSNMYAWARKFGYPANIFQVLCANCNTAKGFYGQCPHAGIAGLS